VVASARAWRRFAGFTGNINLKLEKLRYLARRRRKKELTEEEEEEKITVQHATYIQAIRKRAK
jgi:uncharacterized protein YnzC (UPF0291/DUF896 family)